nr:immunoglobulin heavy chain junction region [Macaca mulatta]MOW87797.1 immunoglobulin heavy chain junction region [Macaca mulatta]MOW88256.1 immunoglobulin heavy chain junction region [Macaca mulatta]MOW89660.1 immunoglobulin heavy chain junction region [Macaca mulatta]MOW89965.1 immunoglobulin heavy chain junction region [Macaca mulatta]
CARHNRSFYSGTFYYALSHW